MVSRRQVAGKALSIRPRPMSCLSDWGQRRMRSGVEIKQSAAYWRISIAKFEGIIAVDEMMHESVSKILCGR